MKNLINLITLLGCFSAIDCFSQTTNLEFQTTFTRTGSSGNWNYTAGGLVATNISVASDEVLKIVQHHVRFGYQMYNGSLGSSTSLSVKYGSSTNKILIYNTYSETRTPVSSIIGQNFYGPCTLLLEASHYGSVTTISSSGIDEFPLVAFYSFEKTKKIDLNQQTVNGVPLASVVVPANATGDVDVLLEQSTDMITWTQCLPGTYNASTQKRFFRVRAVEK
ncbi:MAG: hypothetical protein EBS53_11090 [Bacteroidetes bacterium]|nr:hypothetical protein [Bacteroidota bacterium]